MGWMVLVEEACAFSCAATRARDIQFANMRWNSLKCHDSGSALMSIRAKIKASVRQETREETGGSMTWVVTEGRKWMNEQTSMMVNGE